MSLSADTRLQRWLGRVPDHWSSTPLKYLLRRRTERGRPGAALLSVYRDHGVVPKASRDDNFNRVGKDLEKYLFVRAGDLVINKMKAWQGSMAVSQHAGIVSPAYFTFAVTGSCHGRFLHHLLRSTAYVDEWKRLSAGVRPNQWDLDIDAFGRTPVPLPPLEVQRAIADFLDRKTAAIDTLIEKRERLIALLEEKRQALITQAVTKGLDPNAPMKDSGIGWLGEIPAHWQMKRLKYLSPSVSVGIVITPAKYYDDEGTIPALRSLNVRERRIDRDNLVFITRESNELLSKSVLRVGDLVAVRTGQPGKTAVVPPDLDGANCVDVIIIRQGERYSSEYLCEFMNSSLAHLQYTEGSEGAIQQHFNIETAKNLLIPSPPVEEQRALATRLAAMHARQDRLLELNREQIARLREYRQAVITSAVTGKLDVTSEEAA